MTLGEITYMQKPNRTMLGLSENMHLNSKLLFKKYAKKYFVEGIRVLEIGPDGFPSTFENIIYDSSIIWDTLDIYENNNLTYSSAEPYSFPIPSNYYDIVFSAQVLEHVEKIWVWIKELARVCKKGGLVITINPVSWPYHEAPVDCWRVFPDGMKALLDEAGLKVIFSIFESLEFPNFRRYIPGASLYQRKTLLRISYLILGRFGFPVERSYDTITIGRKENGS